MTTPAGLVTRMLIRKITSIGFVDEGACDGADVLVVKRADTGENMNHTSMKAQTWAEIEKRGEAEQRRDPTLTKHKAIDAVMRTPEGKRLVAQYHDPAAHLSAAEFVAKKKADATLEQLGYRSVEQQGTEAAKLFAAARPDAAAHGADDNLQYGFQMVEKNLPHLWANMQAERGR